MKKTALIMAGGRGERFWPRSRKNMPKQFLSLTDDGITMIQHTVNRILPLVGIEDIYISTNSDYLHIVKEQLPQIPKENILCEPVAKNTAPCIALAAMHIINKYKDALMIVLPSDHLILHKEMFNYTLIDACNIAKVNSNLVTIGVVPNTPEIGYGYIKFDDKRYSFNNSNAFKVDSFIEKPSLIKAKEYLASGVYLWNSGMFVWKASSIICNIQKFLPNIYSGIKNIGKSIGTENYKQILNKEFASLESISIDYGILEKARDIFVVPSSFGWDDVGSWLAMERINKTDDYRNVINGNVISIDTENSIIQAQEKLIATVGVENLIIVDTDDALLVCNKNSSNNIKKVIENLKNYNRTQYI